MKVNTFFRVCNNNAIITYFYFCNIFYTIFFTISIQPSPSRFDQRQRQIEWNEAVNFLADKEENLVFIDVSPPMLSEDKRPRPELYTEDMLHMNEEGYKIWTKLVRENLITYFPEDFKK